MTSNELSLSREAVLVPERLVDTVLEQSVELDYVLPDYDPDFFRLLSCKAEPTITGRELCEQTLTISFCVKLTVWYLAEHSPLIQVITQKLSYQKQIPWQSDLGLSDVRLRLCPAPSYLNCRAINSRRIDIRGAVRLSVRAVGMARKEVLSAVSGRHTHCRKATVPFLSSLHRNENRCTVSETLTIPSAQPPLLAVLREEITAEITETRCIAGKLAVKGEAMVSLLYTAKDSIETLRCPIAISQVIEGEGITEDSNCLVTVSVPDYLLTTDADTNGDIRTLHLDIQLRYECEATKTKTAELITDLYSTVSPLTIKREPLALCANPQPLRIQHPVKTEICENEREISRVYAVWAVPKELSVSTEEASGNAMLYGSLLCYVLAADTDGMPMLLEHTETLSIPYDGGDSLPTVTVTHSGYILSSAHCVAFQAELTLTAYPLSKTEYPLLTDVQLTEGAEPLSGDSEYALRLYYANAQESVWEIAKRYHTAASAIMEENDCTEDTLREPQMLLIPIVQ